MKYLIIGLGNIGEEYAGTRHNLGFEVVDKMAEQEGCTFKNEQLGALAQFRYRGRQVYLLKPSTYMNLSGKAVRFWVQKLKIPHQNWLIITDEIQFDLGKYKLQKKGSDGGHNGLKSVQEIMGTQVYPRLRIGIGNDFYPGQQVDYVLSRWTEDQQTKVNAVIIEATELIRSFVAIGLDRTMNHFNQKKNKEDPQ